MFLAALTLHQANQFLSDGAGERHGAPFICFRCGPLKLSPYFRHTAMHAHPHTQHFEILDTKGSHLVPAQSGVSAHRG